jgi:hypothetical protein
VLELDEVREEGGRGRGRREGKEGGGGVSEREKCEE